MRNVRKKLIILTVVLFAAGTAALKISDIRQSQNAMASPSARESRSVSNTDVTNSYDSNSTVFDDEGDKFVAHRGYSNYAPENSIPAFELAGKMGFWGIETDIYETIDGQFVCLHDETLDRTTDGTDSPTLYTLQQLREFNIDSGNYISSYIDLKIPTLGEYLDICSSYSCVPVIEIKDIKSYDALLNEIYSRNLEKRCVITGELDAVKEIRARNTVIPVMTIGYSPAPYTDSLSYIGEIADNKGILYNYPQVDENAIGVLHDRNIYCGVWSVDEAEVAEQYIGYGADFVVTNEIPGGLNNMINENE